MLTVPKNCSHRMVALLLVAMTWSMPIPSASGQTPSEITSAAVESGDPFSDAECRIVLASLLPKSSKASTQHALKDIAERRDKRFIAPLIDLLRFAKRPSEYRPIVAVLRELTGEPLSHEERPWRDLVIWYGQRESLQPPPGYAAWKGALHAQLVDPRFRQFLYEDVPTRVRLEEVVWGGVKVDGIPALENPRMLPADRGGYLDEAEPVFGVSINGDHRAYPLRILDWHEMANDLVGGKPVALAYCTLCGAAILYDTTVGGQTYDFGSSGFLFRSNKLMYDRQTNSLWNHLTGEPVIGPLAESGITLETLPVVSTSWGRWREQHPDTKVVALATGHKRKYVPGAYYGAYFASPGTMFPVWRQDDTHGLKEQLFALRIGTSAKAYPLSEIAEAGGIIHDKVGSIFVVVLGPKRADPMALPPAWRDALPQTDGPATVEHVGDLSTDTIRTLLGRKPKLIRGMDAAFLLGLDTPTRLEVLTELSPDGRSADRRGRPRLERSLRNEVALRGLINEVRAYERGHHRFRFADAEVETGDTDGPGARSELVDERGITWRVGEDALSNPDGEQLPRIGGHLVYWFGWRAFYPDGAVYQSSPESDTPGVDPDG